MAAAIREELDYRIEAENIIAVTRTDTARHNRVVRLPEFYPALSTERVFMERLIGTL